MTNSDVTVISLVTDKPRDAICQSVVPAVHRAHFAELGRAFHVIVGSHFTIAGRLVDTFYRFSPDRFGQAVSERRVFFACCLRSV